MPERGYAIFTSPLRPIIDDMLIDGATIKIIARKIREDHGETFHPDTISGYRQNYFRSENGSVKRLVKMTKDLSDEDPPPTSNREVLASYFTFKSTKTDLDLIYDRVRELRQLQDDARIEAEREKAEILRAEEAAKAGDEEFKRPKRDPLLMAMRFDTKIDKAIRDYLAQAESIRQRVFKFQYEEVRKAAVLTVGKKITMAAVNTFIPYVREERRMEAIKRFYSAIEPLLGMKIVPDVPKDINDISKEVGVGE